MGELFLVIGDEEKGCVRFGPLTVNEKFREQDGSFRFIMAPIEVVGPDALSTFNIDDHNGIEPSSLDMFRTDLNLLLEARSGTVFFGNHDYRPKVELSVEGESVKIIAEAPGLNKFDIFLCSVTFSKIETLVIQINKIEEEFGPLTGYCQGCGKAVSKYYK